MLQSSDGNVDELNMIDMPHARGIAIDVALYNAKDNSRLGLFDGYAGKSGWYLEYYNDSTDPQGVYCRNQYLLAYIMSSQNFFYGELREVWHFNYL